MRNILILIALFATSLAVAQQHTFEFNTVEEAISHAVENNHNLSKSRIDQEIILAQIAEVKGRALPQINVNGQFSDN